MSWTAEQYAEYMANYRKEVRGEVEQPEHAGVVSATPAKYRNRKKEVDGIVFDSSKEAHRYIYLKSLRIADFIRDLEIQPEFILQEKQAGMRAIKYRADFAYMEYVGKGRPYRRVVEDVKGFRTAAYRIKAKLFRAKFPAIDFREI